MFFVFNDCAYWFFAVISVWVAVGGSSVSEAGVPVGVAAGSVPCAVYLGDLITVFVGAPNYHYVVILINRNSSGST